jgi:hypothetical protein
MAIAQQTLVINTQDSPQNESESFSQLNRTLLQKLLWHTHAYSTVSGMILLTSLSLIFLASHWLIRKLFFTPDSVKTNVWNIKSSQ